MNIAEQTELRSKVHTVLTLFYNPIEYQLNKSTGVFNKIGFEISWGEKRKTVDALYFNPALRVWDKAITEVLQSSLGFEDMVISKITGFRLANDLGCHDYDDLNSNGVDKGTTYKVDFETDLHGIVDHHALYMMKVGFPFFEKMSTHEGISAFINNRILECSDEEFVSENKRIELKNFFGKREVLSGIIAAYLSKDARLGLLLSRFTSFYKGNNYILDDVEKVNVYFSNH